MNRMCLLAWAAPGQGASMVDFVMRRSPCWGVYSRDLFAGRAIKPF